MNFVLLMNICERVWREETECVGYNCGQYFSSLVNWWWNLERIHLHILSPPPYAVAPETACGLSCGSGKGGLAGKWRFESIHYQFIRKGAMKRERKESMRKVSRTCWKKIKSIFRHRQVQWICKRICAWQWPDTLDPCLRITLQSFVTPASTQGGNLSSSGLPPDASATLRGWWICKSKGLPSMLSKNKFLIEKND